MIDAAAQATLGERRKAFRRLCEERGALIVPGAGNALTARIIEDAGFEAIYVTGAGIANTMLGVPDLGLVTLTELAATTSAISEITRKPLIVDIDTGFGNALNAQRTLRVIERAGAFAVQIEDQMFPKKCGHFEGKEVIPLREAVSKIQGAGGRARGPEPDDHRPDRRAVGGGLRGGVCKRAEAYVEAGRGHDVRRSAPGCRGAACDPCAPSRAADRQHGRRRGRRR